MRSLTTALHRLIADLVDEAVSKVDEPLPTMVEIGQAAGCSVKTVRQVLEGTEYTVRRRKRDAEIREITRWTCPICGGPKHRKSRQCLRCKAKAMISDRRCEDCGSRTSSATAKKCRQCHLKAARAARGF